MRDRLVLNFDGNAEEFARAVARRAPETQVHILAPGEPLPVTQSPTGQPATVLV